MTSFARGQDRDIEAEALEFKTKGNTAFSEKRYDDAIEMYSSGLELDPDNHLLLSNRSNVYLRLNRLEEALEDAKRCTEIDPLYVKGHYRKVQALMQMSKARRQVGARARCLPIYCQHASRPSGAVRRA